MKKILALVVATMMISGFAVSLIFAVSDDILDTVMGRFYVIDYSVDGDEFSMISENDVWVIRITDDTIIYFEQAEFARARDGSYILSICSGDIPIPLSFTSKRNVTASAVEFSKMADSLT